MKGLKQKWFRLFASCFLIKGFHSSIIFDSERSSFYEIDNFILSELILIQEQVLSDYILASEMSEDEINMFIRKFLSEEIGFITDNPENFPSIEMNWDSPSIITNSIIQIDETSDFSFKKVVYELNNMFCKAIQIWIEYEITIESLNEILNLFSNTNFEYIEILIPNSSRYKITHLESLVEKFPRIRFIKLYASKEEYVHISKDINKNKKILFFKKDIRINNKEIIIKERFVKNLEVYTESQKFNSGLNRKVCIDKYGNIKNFINHDSFFGNVKSDSILDVVENDKFKVKWTISNDLIEKCKDCQFRYNCVSNSDILINNNKYSKKEKCSFNPYTNKWDK